MVETVADFRDDTKKTLDALGIMTLPPFMEMGLDDLPNIRHIVFDVDGVIRKYGYETPNDVVIILQQFHRELPNGISLMTNSKTPPQVGENIPVFARVGLRVKQYPDQIRRALTSLNVNPTDTLGIGDGLSDVLTYRQQGLGYSALVPSIGPHPLQKFVHRRIYSPVLNVVSKIILD